MSSKASQQTQQTPSWRLAASKPSRQSPTIEQQQQQQQNGPRNGFKPDAKDKPGISVPDRSGRNGSPAALTPSSKASTRPLMNESASRMNNVSPFDAANNMMPSFARKQQQQQPSPYQPMQQQQQKQAQVSNSGDRNGSKTATPTQNKNDKLINEKRKSSTSPTNISEQKTDKEQRTDGEEMGRSKRATVPSPATTPTLTPTPPEMNEKEQTKDVATENSVVSSSASPQPVIKHPLKNKWAMWYFKNDKSKDWKDNQKYVYSFETVEDFWALYNHLLQPSELQSGCDYSLFKEGIEPMWEDPSNKNGGRWLINSVKQQRQYVLDRFWMETLLCLVGEIFDAASEEVCGTVINIRPKGDKLAIWTRNAEDQEKNMEVGRGLRDKLGLPKGMPLGFQAHKDTITKYGSITPNKYFA